MTNHASLTGNLTGGSGCGGGQENGTCTVLTALCRAYSLVGGAGGTWPLLFHQDRAPVHQTRTTSLLRMDLTGLQSPDLGLTSGMNSSGGLGSPRPTSERDIATRLWTGFVLDPAGYERER